MYFFLMKGRVERSGTYCLAKFLAGVLVAGMNTVASATDLSMPFLLPTDIVNPAGVQLKAQLPFQGPTLYDKSGASSIWQTPMGTRKLEDGTVRIWYLRFDYDDRGTSFADQAVLCLGELKNGQWTLPELSTTPPPWGGPNNIVLRRSQYPPKWAAFTPHQIVDDGNGGFIDLYWDQPNSLTAPSGALRAVSADGETWTKIPNTVFHDFNDNFTLRREGNVDYVYHEVLQPWPDKPYADNLPTWKRVISLQTSTDNLATWTPIDVENPTMEPDALDPIETEFYAVKTFAYGDGYAGLLWKYYGDPNRPNQHSQTFRYELIVSQDGVNWNRPYRDTELGFYSYADPFFLDGRMWFPTQGAPNTTLEGDTLLRGWDEGRMVGAEGSGSFSSQLFNRPNGSLELDVKTSGGIIQVTPHDSTGNPIPGLYTFTITNANGGVTLPWSVSALPDELSLFITMGGGAKVFGLASLPGPPPLLGDFNENGIVDAADYSVWRNSLGSNTALPNDDGLGTPIGEQHFLLWKGQFGETNDPGVGASVVSLERVPEPCTLGLIVAGMVVSMFFRQVALSQAVLAKVKNRVAAISIKIQTAGTGQRLVQESDPATGTLCMLAGSAFSILPLLRRSA